MDHIQFLQATANESETFLALQERSTDLKLYGPVGGLEDALREITENILYLLRTHDGAVGSVAYRVRPDGSVCISSMVVDSEHRRPGFARAAMSYILELNKDAPRIDLVTHPETARVARAEPARPTSPPVVASASDPAKSRSRACA